MMRDQRGSRFLASLGMTVKERLRMTWEWLREVSGDDAYERYLRHAASARVTLSEPAGRAEGSASLLTPAEFYYQRMERKYNSKDSPARCC